MNPIWTQIILDAIKKAVKKCPHCGKTGYPEKQVGEFYKCANCGNQFKEKK